MMADRLCALATVLDNAHRLMMNMNDTFGWAVAEPGWLDLDDLDEMLHLVERMGADALVAYETHRRELTGDRPCTPIEPGANYAAALREVRHLAERGRILVEETVKQS